MQIDDLIDFYQTLSPQSLGRLSELYSEHAFFKDPFNEVRGVDAIERIFSHMFRQVEEPRFVVVERVLDAQGAVLVWEFHYRARFRGKRRPELMRGVSHLRFAPGGKVDYHRDYWDTAEELYMKLPVLGALMRGLRRVIAA